jgi:hypothetical protein
LSAEDVIQSTPLPINGDAGGINDARRDSSKSETTSGAFNASLLGIVTTQAQIRAGIASSGTCR